jgi:hypothetical protein
MREGEGRRREEGEGKRSTKVVVGERRKFINGLGEVSIVAKFNESDISFPAEAVRVREGEGRGRGGRRGRREEGRREEV